MYLDKKLFEQEVIQYKQTGVISEKLKEQIYSIIINYTNRLRGRYDEDCISEIIINSYQFIVRTLYKFNLYRYDFEIENFSNISDEVKDELEKYLIKHKTRQNIYYLQEKENLDSLKKLLDSRDISYTVKEVKNSLFSFTTQIINFAIKNSINICKKQMVNRLGNTSIDRLTIIDPEYKSKSEKDFELFNESSYSRQLLKEEDLIEEDIDREIFEFENRRKPDLIYQYSPEVEWLLQSKNEDYLVENLLDYIENSKKTDILKDHVLLFILFRLIEKHFTEKGLVKI